MRIHAILAVFLLVTAAPALAGDDPRELTIPAFLEVPYLHHPVVSDDGRQVAYQRTRRSVEDDEKTSQLWLAERDGDAPRQITFDDGVGGAAWRPGGGLSYLTTRDGESAQVWLNPLDGSEPRAITAVDGGVHAYWWAPDGEWLAVFAEPGADSETETETETDQAGLRSGREGVGQLEGDPVERPSEEVGGPEGGGGVGSDSVGGGEEPGIERTREVEGGLDTDTASDSDSTPEGDFQVFDRLEQPDEYSQLWIIPAGVDGPGEGEARQLTRAPVHVRNLAWSPDGERLALTYNERFSSLVDEEQRIALVDVATGEMETISPLDRHSSLAAFSPDGMRLAYFRDRHAELRAYLNLKDLVLRDLASGEETVLTGETQMTLGGMGSVPGHPPVWSDDGRLLYILAADRTTLDLWQVDARDGRMFPVTRLAGNVRGMDIGGGTLAYVESEQHRPGSLWVRKLRGRGGAVQLDSTDDTVADLGLLPPELLALPGAADGVVVEGYLFLPPGADREGNHPTIIEMHGGPYSRYGNAWTTRYPWHVLSHEGFAVFIANPRGGTAYGEEALQATYRGFGELDFDDLMAAANALVEGGIADPDRMGFTGYSYGGLMTNVVVSRTDRFAAAVSIAGLFNYVSAMGQSNPQLLIDAYRQPWAGDLAELWEDSPASRAARMTTPTLLMHGTKDRPVDPRQSIEMFTYLQLNGVPSRLVLYEGEGHGINRPVHMVDYQTRELEWFRHYLMGDESAAGAEPAVPVEPPAGE